MGRVGFGTILVGLCRESPELRSWQLQLGNLSIDMEGRLWHHWVLLATTSQLVLPLSERRGFMSAAGSGILVRS